MVPYGTTLSQKRKNVLLEYTCTNITLSQKQLEIQALRCNRDTSGRCQHRSTMVPIMVPMVPWYQWYHGTFQVVFEIMLYLCTCTSCFWDNVIFVHVYVPWYIHMYQYGSVLYHMVPLGTIWYHTMVWYTCTNITLSQKVLEYHGIAIVWYRYATSTMNTSCFWDNVIFVHLYHFGTMVWQY